MKDKNRYYYLSGIVVVILLLLVFLTIQNKGVGMGIIKFQDINEENYSNFKDPIYIIEERNNYYDIIITRGEKPTGGYDIGVNKIIQRGNTITLWLDFFDPTPDEFVHQIITYPKVVVRINKSDIKLYTNMVFIFKDLDGKILARR